MTSENTLDLDTILARAFPDTPSEVLVADVRALVAEAEKLRGENFVLSDQIEDMPWCTCPANDYDRDCPQHGSVGLLTKLDDIATAADGVDEHLKAVAERLHSDGVSEGVSLSQLAYAARRWGYACKRCNGSGEADGQGAFAPCPECDGSDEYYAEAVSRG